MAERRVASVPVQGNPFWSQRAIGELVLQSFRPRDLPMEGEMLPVPGDDAQVLRELEGEEVESRVSPREGRGREKRRSSSREVLGPSSGRSTFRTPVSWANHGAVSGKQTAGEMPLEESEGPRSERVGPVRRSEGVFSLAAPRDDDLQREIEKEMVQTLKDENDQLRYQMAMLMKKMEERSNKSEWSELFTTLKPPPRHAPPVTPMPPKKEPTKSRQTTTESTTRVSSETTTMSTSSAKPWKPPKLPKIHLHLPRSHLPTLEECASWAGAACAGASAIALLLQHDELSFMFLLKELQFVGVSSELAGESIYALITRPFRIFLLQVKWPGIHVCRSSEKGDCEPLELQDTKQQKMAVTVVLWFLLSPFLLLLLLLGWWEATSEEVFARRGLLGGIGVRGLRWKLLPTVLVILDIGLFGFADAASVLLLQLDGDALQVELRHWHFQLSFSMLQWLCVLYPVGFCLFGMLQLARLWQRFLVWSPTLQRFADAKLLGVTLRGSHYNRPPANPWAAVAEACDRLTELRVAVPLCGADGEILQLGGPPAPRRRQGCLFAVLSPEEAASAREAKFRTREAQRALLDSGSFRGSWSAGASRKLLGEGGASAQAAWQLEREHLGLLMWMERRSIAYDALKVQINEASGHGVAHLRLPRFAVAGPLSVLRLSISV
eukprot:symbB.v1.2.019288.t1/scaffold1574.1/size208356/1